MCNTSRNVSKSVMWLMPTSPDTARVLCITVSLSSADSYIKMLRLICAGILHRDCLFITPVNDSK